MFQENKSSILQVNSNDYKVISLLGKGKGGYSYLVERDSQFYVLKQIHHEKVDYYQFDNKLQSEIDDYRKLKRIGITMPEMLEVDKAKERILKEYIPGDTIYQLVLNDQMKEEYLNQLKAMTRLLYARAINIDYFPTNFIPYQAKLYYIDYECNNYMDEWNFENWGIKYWTKSPDLLAYMNNVEKETK